EPTNHLDIEAIAWLEAELKSTRAGFVLISHDRAFLRELTRATLWIDRGMVRRAEQGFNGFEEWRDKLWEDEDQQRHKLNRKIKAESRWAVEGISARRKRNQGRVRALQDLRAEKSAQIKRQGTAAMAFEGGATSGKKVVEAFSLTKAYDGKQIVKDFDLTVQRGDRIAFVGPNGVGKTTLIKMLLGQVEPDEGSVKLGTNLDIAVFDQSRAALDLNMTLWDNLVSDPALGASGKSDQIMVRGVPKHVVGYLKEFLFDDAQARAPVRSLSGGEKARLLLAKLMARESNFLVLDEPTNDLDIETLDLLQDILGDYPGTVLLVSHDRDFLDRTATTTIAMEGNGQAVVYAGGWTDYREQRGARTPEAPKSVGKQLSSKGKQGQTVARKTTLSFTEKHRLEELPGVIQSITAEIDKLGQLLADPELFTANPVKFEKATDALGQRQDALDTAEEEWLALEEKAS
ncbi:MAG: ATP-binding cassette subfamily F protein uup, partial [Yoonia sp.]